ncbi:MAG: CPBP family intramembrane metalloprotease [Kiritimatiellae bacterium]|nr:CPBP family intramembrane metalloprotease [Kiritimatiellia bacterium]
MLDSPEYLAATPGIIDLCLSLVAMVLSIAGVMMLRRAIHLLQKSRHLLSFMVNRLANRPWTAQDVLTMGAILAFAYALQLIVITMFGTKNEAGEIQKALLITQTLMMPCAGLLAIGVVLRQHGRSMRTMFGFGERSWRHNLTLAPFCYLAAIPIVIASSLAVQYLLRSFGYPVGPQIIVNFLSEGDLPGWYLAYFAFLAVVVAPIFEELLFRGVVFPVLLRSCPLPLAITAVSLLFAAIHFHLPSVVPLFVIASAFSLGFLWSGDITVPILIHAIFNAVNMTLIILISKGMT